MPTTDRRHFGSARKLPSGRWQVSYWHLGARHVAPHTLPTKTDAQAWLSGVETDIKRGTWLDPEGAKVSLASWLRHWLESVVDGRVGFQQHTSQLRPDHPRPHRTGTWHGDPQRAHGRNGGQVPGSQGWRGVGKDARLADAHDLGRRPPSCRKTRSRDPQRCGSSSDAEDQATDDAPLLHLGRGQGRPKGRSG